MSMLWTRYSFETAGRRKQPKSIKKKSIATMPPKLGAHSKGDQAVASEMFQVLQDRTSGGQCSFGGAVVAFADMPGVSSSLGFPVGTTSVDIATGAALLCNIK